MTLAWSKHLYTPYDTYLDWLSQQGIVVPPPTSEQAPTQTLRAKTHSKHRKRARRPPPLPPRVATKPAPPQYMFHRQYVKDTLQEQAEQQQQQQSSSRNRRRSRRKGQPSSPGFYRSVGHVRYRVPFTQLSLLRAVVLTHVEALIRLEHYENQLVRYRMEKEASSCC